MSDDGETPLLEARGILKRFGKVLANEVTHFSVRAGEVLALVGENGAGKSTLAKILYGYYAPDAGEIFVNGKQAKLSSPRQARALGVAMVFQNFTLIPALSVFENVALFQNNLPAVVPRADILERMQHYAARFHLTIDPWMPARQLAIGDQQKVEILKQLLAGARVLILDEPTTVLAPQESEGLFKTLAELRNEGFAIVLVTHKLREVLACADRIAVMRHGRVVGVFGRQEVAEEKLLALMFGDRAMQQSSMPDAACGHTIDNACSHHVAELALEVIGVSTSRGNAQIALREISFSLRCGEILGIAGVSGNGQRELGDLILGLQQPHAGTKLLWGKDASRWSVAKLRAKGVAAIPDDPLSLACVPSLTVRENLALGTGRRYTAGLGFDWPRLDADMQRSFARLGFPRPDFEARAAALSGGNLQRTVLTRELAHGPKLIVALYPTRGLDVRSTIALRALLRAACAGGGAVLMVSEDLDELFEMSDRLLVLFQGAIAGEFGPEDFRTEIVGPLMVGVRERQNAA
jgi:general nucleoside transport system ATP-binding protein